MVSNERNNDKQTELERGEQVKERKDSRRPCGASCIYSAITKLEPPTYHQQQQQHADHTRPTRDDGSPDELSPGLRHGDATPRAAAAIAVAGISLNSVTDEPAQRTRCASVKSKDRAAPKRHTRADRPGRLCRRERRLGRKRKARRRPLLRRCSDVALVVIK
jgi:hypothetical protein